MSHFHFPSDDSPNSVGSIEGKLKWSKDVYDKLTWKQPEFKGKVQTLAQELDAWSSLALSTFEDQVQTKQTLTPRDLVMFFELSYLMGFHEAIERLKSLGVIPDDFVF